MARFARESEQRRTKREKRVDEAAPTEGEGRNPPLRRVRRKLEGAVGSGHAEDFDDEDFCPSQVRGSGALSTKNPTAAAQALPRGVTPSPANAGHILSNDDNETMVDGGVVKIIGDGLFGSDISERFSNVANFHPRRRDSSPVPQAPIPVCKFVRPTPVVLQNLARSTAANKNAALLAATTVKYGFRPRRTSGCANLVYRYNPNAVAFVRYSRQLRAVTDQPNYLSIEEPNFRLSSSHCIGRGLGTDADLPEAHGSLDPYDLASWPNRVGPPCAASTVPVQILTPLLDLNLSTHQQHGRTELVDPEQGLDMGDLCVTTQLKLPGLWHLPNNDDSSPEGGGDAKLSDDACIVIEADDVSRVHSIPPSAMVDRTNDPTTASQWNYGSSRTRPKELPAKILPPLFLPPQGHRPYEGWPYPTYHHSRHDRMGC